MEKGELAVVLGSSGAGKTTALNILGGMDTATSGELIVDGNNVWYHFDVVPGQIEIREGKAGAISKICVIGTKLNKDLIKSQFLK